MNENNIITFLEHSFVDNLNKDSLVLDCGGYVGIFTDKIIEKYNCNVHIFEADYDLYNNLVKKYNENKNISVFNSLIFGEDKLVDFYKRRPGQTSGSIYHNHPSVGVESVNRLALSLDYIVNAETYRINNRQIDLLKLDIEGAEISVIMNSFKSLNLCKQITVEFHDFCNIGITENDILACISKLELLGFTFENCSLPNKPKYFDCLFYRR